MKDKCLDVKLVIHANKSESKVTHKGRLNGPTIDEHLMQKFIACKKNGLRPTHKRPTFFYKHRGHQIRIYTFVNLMVTEDIFHINVRMRGVDGK